MFPFSETGDRDFPFLMDKSKLSYLGGAPHLGKEACRKPKGLDGDDSEPSKEEGIKINTRWVKKLKVPVNSRHPRTLQERKVQQTTSSLLPGDSWKFAGRFARKRTRAVRSARHYLSAKRFKGLITHLFHDRCRALFLGQGFGCSWDILLFSENVKSWIILLLCLQGAHLEVHVDELIARFISLSVWVSPISSKGKACFVGL